MRKRAAIEFAKKHFKDKAITVAEIGVWQGDNAVHIIENFTISTLYLIDPYREWVDKDSNWYSQEDIDKVKWTAHWKAQQAMTKRSTTVHEVMFIEKTSDEALQEIPKCDLVYVDGNHEYEYVKRDMQNYWGKVVDGGILAGDDYRKSKPGVIRAVDEFVKERNLKVTIKHNDWWIVK